MPRRKINTSKDLFNNVVYIKKCCDDVLDSLKKGEPEMAAYKIRHMQLWFYSVTQDAFRIYENLKK